MSRRVLCSQGARAIVAAALFGCSIFASGSIGLTLLSAEDARSSSGQSESDKDNPRDAREDEEKDKDEEKKKPKDEQTDKDREWDRERDKDKDKKEEKDKDSEKDKEPKEKKSPPIRTEAGGFDIIPGPHTINLPAHNAAPVERASRTVAAYRTIETAQLQLKFAVTEHGNVQALDEARRSLDQAQVLLADADPKHGDPAVETVEALKHETMRLRREANNTLFGRFADRFELHVCSDSAEFFWDVLMDAGAEFGLRPAGLELMNDRG